MSESMESPVDMPVEVPVAERRVALEEQPLALDQAESAGTLPDEDRRLQDGDPVVESPAVMATVSNGEISHIRELSDGTRVDAAGHILG